MSTPIRNKLAPYRKPPKRIYQTYQGDISNPKDSGIVSQFCGNKYVLAGSIRDPGEVGLINPSMMRIATTSSHTTN